MVGGRWPMVDGRCWVWRHAHDISVMSRRSKALGRWQAVKETAGRRQGAGGRIRISHFEGDPKDL